MGIVSDKSRPSNKLIIERAEFTEEEVGLALVADSRDDVRRILARMCRRKGISRREIEALKDLYCCMMVMAGLVERQIIVTGRCEVAA